MNWIILRGLARQSKHWGDFPERFENTPGVGKVLAPDLPGFGTESHTKFPLTIKSAAQYLEDRFQEIKENDDGEWCIMGLSLGGMIALEWAHLFPRTFRGVSIINSSLHGVNAPLARLQPNAVKKLSSWIVKRKSDHEFERGVLNLTSNFYQNNEEISRQWAQINEETKMELRDVLNQLAASIPYKGPKRLSVPLITLTALGDRMVNPQCSYLINERYSGELHVHPDAGHDLPLDAPDWVIQKLVEFQSKL